jgi:hypothetical protein
MSRLRPPFRPAHLAVLAAVLLFAGAKAYRHVQLRRLSPFVLWEFRPGMPFAALEKSALRQMKRRFTCHAVVPGARLCELRVTGIDGLVRVLADARDRVAVVEFLPDSASPVMREEGRRVAAEWSLVRAGEADRREPADSTTSTTRWRSRDGKYGAYMRYDRLGTTPSLVHLTAANAVQGIQQSAPLASATLVLNRLVASRDAGNLDDVSDVLATTVFGRATDPANETPAPAAPIPRLPLCEPDAPDPIVPAARPRADFTESTARLLELAIPAVYPGSRLVLGEGTWIVDSTGRSERVHLGRGDFASADRIAVLAVAFPGRSAVAARRLTDAVPDRYCRAPAELLFVRGNDDGSLAEAHRVPVDEEAIASDVSRIDLAPPDVTGDPPHVRVRYTAAYATDRWTGTLDWEAVIADDPPRARARVPLLFDQQARDGETGRGGHLVITGRPTGGIELSTLERHDWGFATRTFVIPVDSSGALLGVRVLERLF